ncbi:MAG: hypothetical protein AB9903_05475 [Vulcanimicrobiota bacterium]
MEVKIKPEKGCRKPEYPDNDEFLKKNNIEDFIPERWKCDALAVGTLLALTFSGCTAPCAQTQIAASPRPTVQKSADELPTAGNAVAAPIFEHGYGFVRSGGESASHPRFLTEDEARQIIESEFKKAGVTFDRHDIKVNGVAGDYGKCKTDKFRELELTNYKGPVELDGYSTKNSFAYEFVSSDDSNQLLKLSSQMMSTAPPVGYTKPAAQILNDLFAQSEKVNVITFYDPISMKGSTGDLEISRSELKAQISDAITWAKSKGWIRK